MSSTHHGNDRFMSQQRHTENIFRHVDVADRPGSFNPISLVLGGRQRTKQGGVNNKAVSALSGRAATIWTTGWWAIMAQLWCGDNRKVPLGKCLQYHQGGIGPHMLSCTRKPWQKMAPALLLSYIHMITATMYRFHCWSHPITEAKGSNTYVYPFRHGSKHRFTVRKKTQSRIVSYTLANTQCAILERFQFFAFETFFFAGKQST